MSAFIRRFLFDPGNEVLLEIESVNILDLDPPASISGIGTGTVILVGEFENGTYKVPTEVTSANDVLNFAGGMGYTYGGVRGNNPCARSRLADLAVDPEFWNGNGHVQLSGKKFARLILVRVDTSIGAVQFTREASLSGGGAFAYNLGNAQNVVIDDGTGPYTATFTAVAATLTSGVGVYPSTFVGGETLTLGYDAQPDFVVTFLATDQTQAQVIARINQYAGFAFAADAGGGVTTFTGKVKGTAGQVRVVAATGGVSPLTVINIAVGVTFGTGNVQNVNAVSALEINTIIAAATGGNLRVVVDGSGALRIENIAGGGTGWLIIQSLTAVNLGFHPLLSSAADTSVAQIVSTPGTYPTLFAGGETLTLQNGTDPAVTVTFTVADQTQAQVIARINTAMAYTAAASWTATRLRLRGKVVGGTLKVLAASAGVLVTLGLQLEAVTGLVNSAGVLPAGTRIRVPNSTQFVTTQDVIVTRDNAGPYTARIRHALDDGTGIAAAPGTITQVEFPIDLASFSCINATPVTAALTEAALDAAYDDAINSTTDLNSIAKIGNLIYSARQSNEVRRSLRANALFCSASGMFGRMACVRPPLGTAKNVAKSNGAEPGVGATRDQRVIYCYPGFRTFVPTIAVRGLSGGAGFTTDGIVDVGADGFMASLCSQLPPEENPAQDTSLIPGAIALESSPNAQGYDINDYIAFKKAGIAAPRIDNGVAGFQSGITSVDPAINPNLKNIARRRMADFIQDSLAQRLKSFSKKLATKARRNALNTEIRNFLAGLLSKNNPASQRIAGFTIDPISGNTADTLAQGLYRVIVAVRTLASLDSIVVETTIGESVDVGVLAALGTTPQTGLRPVAA